MTAFEKVSQTSDEPASDGRMAEIRRQVASGGDFRLYRERRVEMLKWAHKIPEDFMRSLLATTFAHPTVSEAIKVAVRDAVAGVGEADEVMTT